MKMHEDILRVENLSRIYGQGENEVCALDRSAIHLTLSCTNEQAIFPSNSSLNSAPCINWNNFQENCREAAYFQYISHFSLHFAVRSEA